MDFGPNKRNVGVEAPLPRCLRREMPAFSVFLFPLSSLFLGQKASPVPQARRPFTRRKGPGCFRDKYETRGGGGASGEEASQRREKSVAPDSRDTTLQPFPEPLTFAADLFSSFLSRPLLLLRLTPLLSSPPLLPIPSQIHNPSPSQVCTDGVPQLPQNLRACAPSRLTRRRLGPRRSDARRGVAILAGKNDDGDDRRTRIRPERIPRCGGGWLPLRRCRCDG